MRTTVLGIVTSGGNLARFSALRRRAAELGLEPYARSEWIDWFSLQRNLLIEISGKGKEIVYIVAHYDRTDISPLKLLSLLTNGLIDELVGFTYLTHGATDNATGVAVALELALALAGSEHNRTYRILLTGAEESGLRGARAHVARLKLEEKRRIAFTMNLDTVGLADRDNCLTGDVSAENLRSEALGAAQRLRVPLGTNMLPLVAQADYAPFARNSFWRDLLRGVQINLAGGLLPQRSWFTRSHEAPVINFTACDVIDRWDYVAGIVLLPVGRLHGPRDRSANISVTRLYEQFAIAWELLKTLDERL
jgi:hypothetical protein